MDITGVECVHTASLPINCVFFRVTSLTNILLLLSRPHKIDLVIEVLTVNLPMKVFHLGVHKFPQPSLNSTGFEMQRSPWEDEI